MAGIFICYRRDDTAGWAGRLQVDLQAGLPGTVVFRDIDAIPPGVKFDEYIAEAVGTCDVLIAMIGPRWLNAADAQGVRRLDDPNDLIRLEISTCLKRDIRVIPALVGGADLPAARDLPDDIRELSRRQAYELSDSRWTADCRKLVAALRPILGISRVSRPLVAAGIVGLVLLIAGFLVWRNAADATGEDGVTAAAPPISPIPSSDAGAAAPDAGATQTSVDGAPSSAGISASITEIPFKGSDRPAPIAAGGQPLVEYIATGGQGAGVFDFDWPGGDCWDIYRGDEKVTYGCGMGKQALAAGSYSIRTAQNVFLPFQVTIRPGTTSRVALGGVFDFRWPGGDCWDIYRGDEKISYGCGSSKQALQPGRYTIKNGTALFVPFDVEIKNAVTSAVTLGGVVEFKWPGGDCWDVFRGKEKVTYGCGTSKQALEAGTYTISSASAVFLPFAVKVATGVTTTVAKGGVFEFKWPGGDCWDIYRGDDKVTYGCGAGKQALEAGRYTIKASGGAVFQPFTITVRDGATVVAP